MGVIIFGAGINWGLPSLDYNSILVGSHGIALEAAAARLPNLKQDAPADVVPDSPLEQTQVVPLNQNYAQAARILCRYRLYSAQPDEMITFRSLAQMNPAQGEFDPHLYQYGGLWIYPIGAIIDLAGKFGILDVGGREVYLADPSMFGRFYIIARAYSLLWGLIGIAAVFAIARRMTGGTFLPAVAAAIFIVMPAVVDLSHEAKPHLAGAVLILLAALAGGRFIETGKIAWAILTGILCGAAAGMVLWAAVALAIIPVMALRARAANTQKITAASVATLAAVILFAVTNPYFIYHLFHNPAVLHENLSNTGAMYHLGLSLNGLCLMAVGASPLLLIAGFLGLAVATHKPHPDAEGIGLLLAAPAILVAVPFFLLATGKPGEYARFAVFPDVALAIAAVIALSRLKTSRFVLPILAAVLWITTALYGSAYLSGFVHDNPSNPDSQRALAAQKLQDILAQHTTRPTLGVYADPAPYCLPPLNLIDWKILHLPPDYTRQQALQAAEVVAIPVSSINPLDWTQTPMSWANHPFDIEVRQ
ncbi:MAG TPA: hypothetical protein VMD30_04570 [Tepidisphaeraceae bacterium]|nr:hypothetical protein [Tepidisphaeraceae bacterium]